MTCQLTFLPVGNADSIIVQTDDSTIIVDLGKLSVLEDWLQKHRISKIDRIYVTHAHGDHFPSLIKLKDFLSKWLGVLPIGKIHLPYQVIETARKKVVSDSNSLQTGKLRLALKSISEWSRNRQIKFSPIVRDGEEYHEGVLKIEALHPSQDYVENHLALSYSKLNEISTVLQVSYGEFSAMLLADIEGEGLKELLRFLEANSGDVDFIANVVKIPHHGAYPTNGDDLRDVLALIDAEIAVLSVGSKNTYGHVEPKLFKALIELQNNDVQRLKQFICTEVTRTCFHSTASRSEMEKRGLTSTIKCAGEVTIIADISGMWNLKTEEVNHQDRIKSFNHAACDGRADL